MAGIRTGPVFKGASLTRIAGCAPCVGRSAAPGLPVRQRRLASTVTRIRKLAMIWTSGLGAAQA